jgi:predicted nucleic acid-binding protein
LTAKLPSLVTTSYVFDEVVTYFNGRGHHQKAVEVGNSLLHSPSVMLIQVAEELFHAGWNYIQQFQDKRYSLTDCISFVVMEQRGIQAALTFDRHFTQAGFQREPG